jgi:replication factor A1
MLFKVADLKSNSTNIDLIVKVISINQKEANTQKGPTTYFYGIVGDGTGTIPFTAWTMVSSVRANDVLELKNCSVKLYNERLRLYIDARTQVILRPGEELEVRRTYPVLKIKNISLKEPYVAVEGIVRDVKERPYAGREKSGTLYFGFLEDETGKIRVNSFDVKIEENTGYRFTGAKVSEYNNRLRISVNEKTGIQKIKVEVNPGPVYYDIHELKSPVSGIYINGFIVNVGEKGGAVYRCQECRKTAENGKCPDHPDSTVYRDYFLYFTLEDGTGYIQGTCGKSALTSYRNEWDEAALEKISMVDQGMTEIKKEILGSLVTAMGEVVSNQNGLTLRISEMKPLGEKDIEDLSRKYLEEV